MHRSLLATIVLGCAALCCGGNAAAAAAVRRAHITNSLAAAAVVDWSTLTADTLALLAPADVAAATQAQLSTLPSAACAGWSPVLLGAVGAAGAGLTPACITNIPPAAIGDLTPQCAGAFTLDQTNALTVDQFDALPPASFAQLANLAELAEQCAGFTKAQLAQGTHYDDCSILSNVCLRSITPVAYSGIKKECVATIQTSCGSVPAAGWSAMPDAAFAGIDRICANSLLAASFGLIRASQLAQIQPSAFVILPAKAFGGINPPACKGFTSNQLLMLNMNQCFGMTAGCLSALPAIPGMVGSCLGAIPTAVFPSITATQIAAFGSNAMMGITAVQMGTLGAQCTGFTPLIASHFSGTAVAACTGVSATCAPNIPTGSMASFDSLCVRNLPSASVGAFSTAQLSHMDLNIAGFNVEQLLAVYAQSGEAMVAAWTDTQQASISQDTMTQWLAAVEAGTVEATHTWTGETNLATQGQLDLSICTAGCMGPVFATTASPNTLATSAWGGLRRVHVSVLSTAGIASLTSLASWSAWSSVGLYTLDAQQVAAVSAQAFTVINPGALAPEAMPGLTLEQLQSVPAATWSQLPCANLLALNAYQLVILQQSVPDFNTHASTCAGYTPPASSPPTSGVSKGTLIGIGVGSGVGALIIIALACACYRRHKRNVAAINADVHTRLV